MAQGSGPTVQGLRCRECGREYATAPIYTCEWCFGPLEVAYDYDAIARSVEPREDRGRPVVAVAVRRPASRRGQPVGRPRDRLHAARARRSARGRARPRRGVAEERHPQPDELVQGPRRHGRVEQGARVRFQGRGVCLDGQPRELGRRARRACGTCVRTCSSPPTSSRARSSRPRCTAATSSRSTATTTTSTGCVPSSPECTSGRS